MSKLIILANLDDNSGPDQQLTYWLWSFPPICGQFNNLLISTLDCSNAQNHNWKHGCTIVATKNLRVGSPRTFIAMHGHGHLKFFLLLPEQDKTFCCCWKWLTFGLLELGLGIAYSSGRMVSGSGSMSGRRNLGNSRVSMFTWFGASHHL